MSITLSRNERIEADKKFIVVDDWADIRTIHIKQLGKVNKDTYQSTEGREYQYFKDLCLPYTDQILAEIAAIVSHREGLKKVLDDSVKLVYELNNKIARKEL